MISIVNRGVESGGGDGYRYGSTIADLLTHYVVLLSQQATNEVSPGPLQFLAIILELVSLTYMANVLFFQNGKMKYNQEEDDILGLTEPEECPLIDIVEVSSSVPNGATPVGSSSSKSNVRVVVNNNRGTNGNSGDPFFASATESEEAQRAKVVRCLEQQAEDEEELDSEGDSTVSPMY